MMKGEGENTDQYVLDLKELGAKHIAPIFSVSWRKG